MMLSKEQKERIVNEITQTLQETIHLKPIPSLVEDIIRNTIKETETALTPPRECMKCGGKLNRYVGSHTSVRVLTLKGLQWWCTTCFLENVKPDREQLAALEHEQFVHWTKYMLENLTPENIERWKKQIETPYNDLSEKEKESDRAWADKVLELIR